VGQSDVGVLDLNVAGVVPESGDVVTVGALVGCDRVVRHAASLVGRIRVAQPIPISSTDALHPDGTILAELGIRRITQIDVDHDSVVGLAVEFALRRGSHERQVLRTEVEVELPRDRGTVPVEDGILDGHIVQGC